MTHTHTKRLESSRSDSRSKRNQDPTATGSQSSSASAARGVLGSGRRDLGLRRQPHRGTHRLGGHKCDKDFGVRVQVMRRFLCEDLAVCRDKHSPTHTRACTFNRTSQLSLLSCLFVFEDIASVIISLNWKLCAQNCLSFFQKHTAVDTLLAHRKRTQKEPDQTN